MERWFTVADAARRFGLSPESVRDLEQRGLLKAIRTVGGYRLFQESEVERYAALRKQRRAAAEAAAGGS